MDQIITDSSIEDLKTFSRPLPALRILLTLITITTPYLLYYFLLFSSQIAPKVSRGEESMLFSKVIKNAKRKFLGLFTIYVNQIQIEIISSIQKTPIILNLNKTNPTECFEVKKGMAYTYRFRTKEDYLSWSFWSDETSITIETAPYSIVPANPGQKDCLEKKESIQKAGNCNILMIGKPGNGKSSFLNTLLTAFNGVWTSAAVAYPSTESVTKKQCLFDLCENIKLYDMPGWERGHTFDFLGKILEGKCQNATISDMKNGACPQCSGTPQSKINVVMFIIAADCSDEEKGVYDKLLEQLYSNNMPCVAVVTKIDKLAVSGENAIERNTFFKDPRVIQRCNEIKSKYIDNVLPIMNYTCFEPNNTSIDFVALQALDIALKLAKKN